MRARDALRLAKRFVAEKYPDLRYCYIEVALEHDGARRRRTWSFGVHIDEEDVELAAAWGVEPRHSFTGYVHYGDVDPDRPTVSGIF